MNPQRERTLVAVGRGYGLRPYAARDVVGRGYGLRPYAARDVGGGMVLRDANGMRISGKNEGKVCKAS